MFKKLVSILILLCFSSTLVFAQKIVPNVNQMETYLDSSAGRQFLQSEQGQELAEKYGLNSNAGKTENEIPDWQIESVKEAGVEKRKERRLSEIELMVSKNLLSQGKNPLRQYGYDLFQPKPRSAMIPEINSAPADYIVGPGDSFNITLWGITEGIFKIEVNQEGDIILPKIGMVSVAGLRYGELQPFVEKELRKYYEGVNVALTIDNLRAMQVYVVGEVNNPGSYNLNSLSTVFNALFAAGGPTKKGSLRKIRVVRNGQTIATLDLYKFLLQGDKGNDRALQSGDTIFVPIIGQVAGISGQVYRPGIYELNGATDLKDLIEFAGGFLPTSYLNRVQVNRTVAHESSVVRDENVSLERSQKKFGLALANMDLVEVFPIYEKINNIVVLEGEVKYPGNFEFREGMRVKDVLPDYSAFIPSAYNPHIEVVRTDTDTREIKILSIDFNKLYAGDENENLALKPLDTIFVSAEKKEVEKITLSGEVLRPGIYTITKGEKLSSVLERAGGYTSDAYLFGAKFTRQNVKYAQEVKLKEIVSKLEAEISTSRAEVDITSVGEKEKASKQAQAVKAEKLLMLAQQRVVEGRVILNLSYPIEKFKNTKDDIVLEGGDSLYVPQVSNVILVLGEVFSPSAVVYQHGKNLKYYLDQVGGATKYADKSDIYLIRPDGSVKSREQGINVVTTELIPGDTVVVPQVVEKIDVWAKVQDTTRWLYEAVMAWALIYNVVR